jgi:hypothetical protein
MTSLCFTTEINGESVMEKIDLDQIGIKSPIPVTDQTGNHGMSVKPPTQALFNPGKKRGSQ